MESLQVGLLPSGNDNRAQGWGMEGRTEQLGEARALERPVVHRSLAQPYAGQITGSSRYTLASGSSQPCSWGGSGLRCDSAAGVPEAALMRACVRAPQLGPTGFSSVLTSPFPSLCGLAPCYLPSSPPSLLPALCGWGPASCECWINGEAWRVSCLYLRMCVYKKWEGGRGGGEVAKKLVLK